MLERDLQIRELKISLQSSNKLLETLGIESKANEYYSRLMSDLSQMFQMPDMSI